MENKEEVRVKAGDILRITQPDLFINEFWDQEYVKVTRVDQDYWYYIDKNGDEDYWVNPLSEYFELAKNQIVINILNDL